MTSAFESYKEHAWPHRFGGTLLVDVIAGGIPSDPSVGESFLKTKLADSDDLIRQKVAEMMVERGIDAEEAAAEVNKFKHLNGFKRDENGLYIEGRQLKASLKEAASVAANAGKISAKGWGNPNHDSYKKGIKGWFPEHVFVMEERLYLGVAEPTGIMQRFVHSRQVSAIQYEEYVENAKIDFTVATDYDFTEKQWAMLWLTGEQQGLGASRSQGYGRYTVERWERLT